MNTSKIRMAASFARLGVSHVANDIADMLYARSRASIDLTKPRRVYGIVNERCNMRCLGCHYWRLSDYRKQMTTAEWIAALADLKAFLGAYHINFSGGEPLLRKDLFEILGYCRDHGIHAGVTTSGSVLGARQAKALVEARPFTLNISMDGATAATHDAQRGVPGSHAQVLEAIRLVREQAAAAGARIPIIVKPTVTALNFTEMPALARLAASLGCGVLFQPVSDWGTPETERLWIADLDTLRAIVAELFELRASGVPILNTPGQIQDWVRHFLGEPSPPQPGGVRCSVGMDTLIINANGDVHSCERWDAFGNVTQAPIGTIWRSEAARRARAAMLTCSRGCTENCTTRRPLAQRVRGALHLLRSE